MSNEKKVNIEDARIVEKMFPCKVSRYYANLANTSNAVRLQCYPDIREISFITNGKIDPNAESEYEAIPRLIHKYPTKVAILISDDCFTYCRHCTRKYFVLRKTVLTRELNWKAVHKYISEKKEITDVLLTGGDALYISNNELAEILNLLDQIPNIRTIRIGTRALVTHPSRINSTLLKILIGHKPIWIQTQFNHVDEITPESIKAVKKLTRRGFQINNQTVLLKNVNDSEEQLTALFSSLIEIGVHPYYIYHCDNVPGIRHFITDYCKSRLLIKQVASKLPGYAMPRYILDTPTKYGKICIELNHVKSFNNSQICFFIDNTKISVNL